MEKGRSEEQIPPFTPQVNVAEFSNLENIMQQVSWVKTNNIDLGGRGVYEIFPLKW